MQAAILIADGIITSRVSLRVKLSAAWFDVSCVESAAAAHTSLIKSKPALIVLRDSLADLSAEEFLNSLKSSGRGNDTPVIVLSDDTKRCEALLRAGASHVEPCDCDIKLLLARIRSVLRADAAVQEWKLRDGTNRALGFAEPASGFEPAPQVTLLHPDTAPALQIKSVIDSCRSVMWHTIPLAHAMRDLPGTARQAPVVLLHLPPDAPESGLAILADLRANPATRHSAVMVIAPEGRSDLAAQALDLGAEDVSVGIPPEFELSLRLKRLQRAQKIGSNLRATLHQGAEAAVRDPLTGLFNRRYATPHVHNIAMQAAKSGRPFAVMIADLDHFKRVNDWHGHIAGDAVLKICAARLQDTLRASDLLARIGGEEFLIVLPGADRDLARQAALRLCRKISEQPVSLPNGTRIDVTISIGLAISARPAGSEPASPDALIARADQALYAAKAAGRNGFRDERPAA